MDLNYKVVSSATLYSLKQAISDKTVNRFQAKAFCAYIVTKFEYDGFERIPTEPAMLSLLAGTYQPYELKKAIEHLKTILPATNKNHNFPVWEYNGKKSGVKILKYLLKYLAKRGTLNTIALVIWISLHNRKSNNFIVNIKQSSIAKHLKTSRKSINQAISTLVDDGILVPLFTPRHEIIKHGIKYVFSNYPIALDGRKYVQNTLKRLQ